MNNLTFGERLKNLRKEKGLTQEALARILFTNKSCLSRYENSSQVPELEMLKKYSKFFDVSIDYMLCNSNIKQTQGDNFFIKKLESLNELDNKIKELVNGIEKINTQEVLDSNEYISILNRIKGLDTKRIEFALSIAEDLYNKEDSTTIFKKLINAMDNKEV